jgi:hypothetical protein
VCFPNGLCQGRSNEAANTGDEDFHGGAAERLWFCLPLCGRSSFFVLMNAMTFEKRKRRANSRDLK